MSEETARLEERVRSLETWRTVALTVIGVLGLSGVGVFGYVVYAASEIRRLQNETTQLTAKVAEAKEELNAESAKLSEALRGKADAYVREAMGRESSQFGEAIRKTADLARFTEDRVWAIYRSAIIAEAVRKRDFRTIVAEEGQRYGDQIDELSKRERKELVSKFLQSGPTTSPSTAPAR